MARHRIGLAALAAAILLIATGNAALAASVDDWRADLQTIVDTVRARHPDPFTRIGRLTFLRRAERLRADLPRLGEEQRMVEAMRLVALIGDGHTQLGPDNPAFALWYPVRIYQFEDGYFITSAFRSEAALAGAQVLEIAGRPVEEVIEAARQLHGADNGFGRREGLFAVHNAALMKGLGYAPPSGELKLRLRLRDGRTVERTLAPMRSSDPRYKTDDATFAWTSAAETIGPPLGTPADWVSAFRALPASAFRVADPGRPPHLTLRRALLARGLPEKDAYYIQINHVNDAADETLDAFIARALREIEAQKPRRMILDLRYNVGGDGSRVPRVIRELARAQDRGLWREIYLLTGPKTFSAAIMFADAAVDTLSPAVIGEPMGAALNSYGDAALTPLPRTGMRLNVSTARHQLSDYADLSEFAPVDVPAAFTAADWMSGRDPAVDRILAGEEMRSLYRIAVTDGGAALRRAWEARKAAHSRVAWWSPPAEPVLRRATQELVDAKRLQDAVETAVINTEIHPKVWNTWYNLAHAQIAAGQTAAARASYRQVLALDPNNFNGDEIRAALAEGGSQ